MAASTPPGLFRLLWLSVAAAVATISLETTAWLATGSVGLLSDALESVVNLVATVVAIAALRRADNLVPHVLRIDGVLVYDPEPAGIVDPGRELPADGPMEREIRACAVHACELVAQRLDVAPRTLDNWLWNCGQHVPDSERPAHLPRTVFY